ncbi:MAG: hypothetical protein KIT87_21835, partial [Anaerolineae bacterium]|nr:hypothetical protein [Anaerolineae bacterium]
PAWILEMGWSAVPENMPAPFGRVTDEQQARYTVGAYRRIETEYPWAGVGCLWFFRRPNPEWLQRPEGYFRLVTPDWTPLPAYTALQAEATAPPRLPTGFQHISHPAFQWSGPWQVEPSPAALLKTWTRGGDGATASFTFTGSGAALAARRGPEMGRLTVSVDGGTARTLDLAGLMDEAVSIPLADGLLLRDHTITLRVERSPVILEGVGIAYSYDGWWRRIVLVLSSLIAVAGLGLALRARNG